MNSLKNTVRKHFTIVPNELINDSSLPDRSRFLFVLLSSKPDDWEFYNKDLAKSLGYSIETLRNYMRILEAAGWLVKSKAQRIKGRFATNEYTLNASPLQVSPCREKPVSEKNRVGKNHTQTNTNYNKKEKKRKKDFNLKSDANSTIPGKRSNKQRGPLK